MPAASSVDRIRRSLLIAAGAVLLLSTADLPLTAMALLAVLAGAELLGTVLRSMARDAVSEAALDRLLAPFT